MYYYQVIEIVNREPLKIGSGGSKSTHTEPSKEYIPGSTLRGALIAQLIRQGCFEEYKRELLTRMECYNAYPFRNEALFWPTPCHLRVNKHEWREKKARAGESVKLNDLLVFNHGAEEEGKNGLEYRFVTVRSGQMGPEDLSKTVLTGIKVAKEYRMHHRVPRLSPAEILARGSRPEEAGEKNRGEEENLFRYEAISVGQVFRGVIRFPESLRSCLEPILKEQHSLYLGGSKGTGYGLCQWKPIAGITKNYLDVQRGLGISPKRTPFQVLEKDGGQVLRVVCLADVIVRDEYGQPSNDLRPYLEHKLRFMIQPEAEIGQISDMGKILQPGITEGYNSTWKARYPKETTIRAGSVFQYRLTQALPEERLRELALRLESCPIGSRTQDGFGWIGLAPAYPACLKIKEETAIQKGINPSGSDGGGTPAAFPREGRRQERRKQVMTVLTTGLSEAKERWLSMLYVKAGEAGHLTISPDLKPSQFHRMENRLAEGRRLSLGDNTTPFKQGDSSDSSVRYYEQDNNYFAIYGVNFVGILAYIKETSRLDVNSPLTAYARKILNTQKGKLFYPDSAPEQEFIADVLQTTLYLSRRRKKA